MNNDRVPPSFNGSAASASAPQPPFPGSRALLRSFRSHPMAWSALCCAGFSAFGFFFGLSDSLGSSSSHSLAYSPCAQFAFLLLSMPFFFLGVACFALAAPWSASAPWRASGARWSALVLLCSGLAVAAFVSGTLCGSPLRSALPSADAAAYTDAEMTQLSRPIASALRAMGAREFDCNSLQWRVMGAAPGEIFLLSASETLPLACPTERERLLVRADGSAAVGVNSWFHSSYLSDKKEAWESSSPASRQQSIDAIATALALMAPRVKREMAQARATRHEEDARDAARWGGSAPLLKNP